MQDKIFIFFISGILLISLLAFAMAEENDRTPNLISMRDRIEKPNKTIEKVIEIRQNMAEIRQNWTDYKEQIRENITNQRMDFVRCVSEAAKVKNGCYNATRETSYACRFFVNAVNNSDQNATMQCLSEYKDAKAECWKAKHSFFDSLRVMFK